MNKQIWLPETLAKIKGKAEKEKVSILLDQLLAIAVALEGVKPSEIHAITGAPMEECEKMLSF